MAASPGAAMVGGAPSGSRPVAPRAGLVNFTGNWLMDVGASDSLDPLLAYHGFAVAASNTIPTASSAAQPNTNGDAGTGTGAATATGAGSSPSASVTLITTTASGDGQLRQQTTEAQAADATCASPAVTPSLLSSESLLAASPSPSAASPSLLGSGSGSSSAAAGLPTVNEDSRRNSAADLPSAQTAAAAVAATSAAAAAAVAASVPALIVQHNVRKLTTFLHALIPRYGPSGQLLRYDPATTGKLSVHEEYRLDGQYHSVLTPRGRVEARAYHAPHGQSLVVDTRCASKYDLERTERFLEDGGKRLVIETRILSCAPQIQADAATPATSGVSSRFDTKSKQQAIAPNQLVVKELLFLRRVFKRIIDADPKAAAAAAAAAAHAAASSSRPAGSLDFESAVGHPSPLRLRATGAVGDRDGAASQATLLRSQLSATALAILPGALTASPSSAAADDTAAHSHSLTRALSALLYPRHVLLRRYPLADVAAGTVGTGTDAPDGAAALSPALAEAVAREHTAFRRARSQMALVDLALAGMLILLLLRHFGLLSASAV